MIKVIFRMAHYDDGGEEVLAFFPELPGTNDYNQDCLCYAHVGQHSSASLDFYSDCTRPATPEEYKDLLDELQEIYERQLRVYERMTRADFEKRREAVNNVR